MKLLKKLYSIYSPSGNEEKLRNYITNWITNNVPETEIEVDEMGNIYARKGTATNFPCIVAHLDQVQRHYPRDYKVIETPEILAAYSTTGNRFCGLGADDKNGVFIALKMLQKHSAVKIALFVSEEIGVVGSFSANMAFFGDCRFVIECDRRGAEDFVTNISGVDLCSKQFIKACKLSRFGFRPSSGALSDVYALKENGLPISCVNLSCGYYDPHTENEFTIKKHLLNTLQFVDYIITNCRKVYKHTPTPQRWDYGMSNRRLCSWDYNPHSYPTERDGWGNWDDFEI